MGATAGQHAQGGKGAGGTARIVYLDVNHWITLSKVRSGLEPDPILRALYGRIDGLSKSGEIVVPFSLFTVIEASRYHKRGEYRKLVDLLVDLSGGHVLKPSSYFLEKEIENAMCRLVGEKPGHDIRSEILGRGPADLVNYTVSDTYEKISFLQHRAFRRGLGDSGAAERFEELRNSAGALRECLMNEDVINGIREAHGDANELISGAEAKRYKNSGVSKSEFERRLMVGDFDKRLIGVMNRWAAKRGVPPRKIEDLLKRTGIEAFRRSIPAHHTRFTLALARDLQAGRPLKTNDLLDIANLAVAIPYADVVVTDKMAAHLATSKKLDKLYGCAVLDDLKKLACLPPFARVP